MSPPSLDLSPTTVICHRQHIFQKLNLHSLADLILYAVRKGIISPQRSGVARRVEARPGRVARGPESAC